MLQLLLLCCIAFANLVEMCEQRIRHFVGCNHDYAYDYARCTTAFARPNQAVCVPASGYLRDLPRSLDVQDANTAGLCPACAGKSPPSSQGSQ